MEKTRIFLTKLPPLTLTVLALAPILWLTLAPNPLGKDSPSLFEGADKMIHAIMFGFLATVMFIDIQRRSGWKPLPGWKAVAAASASSVAGILIEFAQAGMGLGRGFETADIAADIVGATLAAILWEAFQNRWSVKS